MARRRKNEGVRVYGPYRNRVNWRVILVDSDGKQDPHYVATYEEALQLARSLRRKLAPFTTKTINEVIEEYRVYLQAKENKPQSIADTVDRLRMYFPELDMHIGELQPSVCAAYYEDLCTRRSKRGKPYSVDTQRNVLAEAKTFGRFCVKKGHLQKNPLEDIEPVGKRKHGKEQLRVDEGRRWLTRAMELAEAGEAGAVAAMMAMVMGMRASEIVNRVVRDVDNDGWLLWIPHSKTPAGRRTLEVPPFMRRYFKRLSAGKGPDESLLGKHWRDWPREWVQRICAEVGVPKVTAHGMRGMHSTVAIRSGITPNVVATAMGHEKSTTTLQSYAKPEAVQQASQNGLLAVLDVAGVEAPEGSGAHSGTHNETHNSMKSPPAATQPPYLSTGNL